MIGSIFMAMQGAVAQGVLWGIMTLGVYLTFRILNIADMTCDGSFALGGSVCAVMVVKGYDPGLALFVSFAIGLLAGGATGILHTKFKIQELLAGILTMTALYSVNIRIMGKSNTPLIGAETVMKKLKGFTAFISEKIAGSENVISLSPNATSLIIGIVFCVVLVAVIYWFCGTEIGSSLRATGNNGNMVRAMGVDTDKMKILGLMISNGLIALSGALVAQSQGYGDVGMGTGTLVVGLASIILGEAIFGWLAKKLPFWFTLLSVIFGSIVYRIVIAVVLQLGLKTTDLKLFTAIIIAIALAIPVIKARSAAAVRQRDAKKEINEKKSSGGNN